MPWSSLRFQDDDGKVVMGITSWRYIAAKNEVDLYPAIRPDWGNMSMWKASQMQEFAFEGIYAKKPLYIAPYVLTGIQQQSQLNMAGDDYDKINDPTLEAGLDLKIGLTNNFNLDLTVNTDFAQVEADDQQVNLTRFSLFFPEKRVFFQERASVFNFNFDFFNRLFYSRRIGLNADAEQVRILGGARVVGRAGKSDIGFINMQTAKSGEMNGENFGLLRVRTQVLNANSFVGGIISNRMDFDSTFNTTYGVDGIFRLFGDEYLTARFAQSMTEGLDNNVALLDPTRLFLSWERRKFDGFNYNILLGRAGEDYNPSMGFEERSNFTTIEERLRYGISTNEDSPFIRINAFLFNYNLFRNRDAVFNGEQLEIETQKVAGGVELEFKTGAFSTTFFEYAYEDIPEAFELGGGALIEAKQYRNVQFNYYAETPGGSLIGSSIEGGMGSFFDGFLFSIGTGPRWTFSKHLKLNGFYQYNRINFGEDIYPSHLARVRGLYMLNTKFSIAAFVQYNSLDESFGSNVRLRYNPKEGNDLYIVYNDLINANRLDYSPVLPVSQEKAIVLKYTYTFGF